MHAIKPLDKNSVIKAAKETIYIITVEECCIYRWRVGAAVAEIVVQYYN